MVHGPAGFSPGIFVDLALIDPPSRVDRPEGASGFRARDQPPPPSCLGTNGEKPAVLSKRSATSAWSGSPESARLASIIIDTSCPRTPPPRKPVPLHRVDRQVYAHERDEACRSNDRATKCRRGALPEKTT